ncbi:phosphopantetheine-binding protein [Sorangium sp. So ce590]|uniref:phosphopantetheine-binding protein n=1 Tax=unclassified Sorangium TaxID=2621164 RepID=UPI003F60E3A7
MTNTDAASVDIPPHVVEAVKRCIVESLAVEADAVELGSRLIDDLGADSLDFVDIVFMVDHELHIRARESEFNFITRLDFSSPEVMKEGFLTGPVVARLETWLPALAAVEDKTRVTPRQLFSLITVEALCIVAARRLAPPAAGVAPAAPPE